MRIEILTVCNQLVASAVNGIYQGIIVAAFVAQPRAGEVYNLGGGKANSTSILEAFKLTENFTEQPQVYTYVDQPRTGDHICYYSDLRKMRAHYPSWNITLSLEDTIRQIVEAWRKRPAAL